MLMQNVLGEWGGGGANKVHFGRCASRESLLLTNQLTKILPKTFHLNWIGPSTGVKVRMSNCFATSWCNSERISFVLKLTRVGLI